MKKLYRIFSLAVLSTLLLSCNNKERKSDEKHINVELQQVNENFVDTMLLRSITFDKQIKCNGKLRAVAKSELNMPTSGMLRNIYVKNGSMVKKGDLLASIDKEDAILALQKAEQDLERARVDLQDKLIGLGFDEDTTGISENLLKRIMASSGYTAAVHSLENAKRNLKKCDLVAPFNGRIADINCKLHQRTEKFCTLIDDTGFDVEFNILETEYPTVEIGQTVTIAPFIDSNKNFEGKISEINPKVDENGQVLLRARVNNVDNFLIEGMNVDVVLSNSIPNMFVVPKDAVVMRDGYPVIFRYIDGEALWTYVDIIYSNIESYAITGNKKKETTIESGDIVITSGNLNLADGTKVRPRSEK